MSKAAKRVLIILAALIVIANLKGIVYVGGRIAMELFSIPANAIKSADYKTGVTEDGKLRLAYKYVQGESAYCDGYDKDILQEEKWYVAGSKEIHEFTPLKAGSTDMAVWGHEGFRDESRYDMYHITVDGGLNISYTTEEISKEEFDKISDE